MSYCRWSSDDFQCDVYVYESDEGYVTHVAGRRYVFTKPLPAPIDFREDLDGRVKRHANVSALLNHETLVDIDLPHAGETFVDDGPQEAAATLRRLRSIGYRVPDYAIEALEEEARDERP